jgi:hypothetical protein
MGTFLLFLLGYPGHTELLIEQPRRLFQQLIQLALVFLGLVTPVSQSPSARFQQALARARHHLSGLAPAADLRTDPSAVTQDMMFVPMKPIPRHWTYIFEGKATLLGKPCPNANVLVHLDTEGQSVTKQTITGSDGSYSLRASISADESEPIDWTVEAEGPDLKKVELVGRQIVQYPEGQDRDQAQSPIIITNPVAFTVSLAK